MIVDTWVKKQELKVISTGVCAMATSFRIACFFISLLLSNLIVTDGTPRAPRAGVRLRVIAACLNTRSRYNYSIFDRALLKENYKGPVYTEKPGALTICMENPEIPGRIHDKWNGSTPVKIFPKNSNTFRGITFLPFLPKRPKFSLPFVWITIARLHVERKRKIYWYFVDDTIQPRSCFRCKKNNSTI